MEKIVYATLAKLERMLQIELSYRRAFTAHHGGRRDPYQAKQILVSESMMGALQSTEKGEPIDSGRIKHIGPKDGKGASVLWFSLPVAVDTLLRERTYRIEPLERPL